MYFKDYFSIFLERLRKTEVFHSLTLWSIILLYIRSEITDIKFQLNDSTGELKVEFLEHIFKLQDPNSN